MNPKIKKNLYIYIAVALSCIALILAKEVHFSYFYMIFCSSFFIWLSYKETQKIDKKKTLFWLREHWGKEKTEKIDIEKCSILHLVYSSMFPEKLKIDDRTWEDLEMNSVFSKINHTLSTAGEQVLYSILRQPLQIQKDLDERESLISVFTKNPLLREEFQLIFSSLGKNQGHHIPLFLNGDLKNSKKSLIIYRITSLFTFLLLLSIPIYPLYCVPTLILMFFIHLGIHYKNKEKLFFQLNSLSYIGKMLSIIKKFPPVAEKELSLYMDEIKNKCEKVKSIEKKVAIFHFKDPLSIMEYIHILFLTEAMIYLSTIQLIIKYKQNLLDAYYLLGLIDSMVAIASYRSSLPYYSIPSLSKEHKTYFFAREVFHPLLSNPVSNDLHLKDKKILLTGSNMSGKSTFLRTIGINALLSQTIHTSLSKEYKSNYVHIISSIGTEDNLSKGESYFLVEAKRILKIIQTLNPTFPCLCIIDEIFRGTNTLERIAASKEVLTYLGKKYCYVFAATHDLELTSSMKDTYENYHFEEAVFQEDIQFDYKIKKGPSTTRNAIKILELLHYPKEIPENAEAYIKKTLEKPF